MVFSRTNPRQTHYPSIRYLFPGDDSPRGSERPNIRRDESVSNAIREGKERYPSIGYGGNMDRALLWIERTGEKCLEGFPHEMACIQPKQQTQRQVY